MALLGSASDTFLSVIALALYAGAIKFTLV